MSDEADRRKPTQRAERYFSLAANKAFPGILGNGINNQITADVLHKLAAGLEEMAIGLRATYMLLSEVKEIERQILNRLPK